jgi:hypothetical protein
MRRIAIHDANILIDLVKTGLFDYCMKLEYRFITTDFVFDELYEEQQKQVAPYITEGRFVIISISDLALLEITRLNQEDNRLSPQDCSALHFAIENNTSCLLVIRECGQWLIKKRLNTTVFSGS